MPRTVVVTGTGLISCRGEGAAPHLAALADGSPAPVVQEPFSGYPVHAAPPLEWDRQIPKKSDQRQMEGWQRLGCYGAGLALEAAGVRDDAALKARMQMIVSAGGGERDYAVDEQILGGVAAAPDAARFVNERLVSDLRPTLFLAQLSNLLAGNIAIVHGVTGASRTFMGEEASGLDAMRIAEARISAGQADIMLVGGSFNAERPDLILIYELGGFYDRGPVRPVAEREGEESGFVFGSGAGFLVLEAEEHAAARGVRALARLDPVLSERSEREPGDIERVLARLLTHPPGTILSGMTGTPAPSREEQAALAQAAPSARVIRLADLWGQMMEAAAPAAVALAVEMVAAGDADEVAATVVGHRRGEGLLRVARLR